MEKGDKFDLSPFPKPLQIVKLTPSTESHGLNLITTLPLEFVNSAANGVDSLRWKRFRSYCMIHCGTKTFN